VRVVHHVAAPHAYPVSTLSANGVGFKSLVSVF